MSALPTFLLCFGPNLSLLITYFVVFSIGEALWSARFLEYASELAPEGRVAQYNGLANVPWLLAQGTTGLYSGMMLASYVPANTPQPELQTGTLWFIDRLHRRCSPPLAFGSPDAGSWPVCIPKIPLFAPAEPAITPTSNEHI